MYNTQMTSSRLLSALSLCLLVGVAGAPTAFAYLLPEEALTGASYDTSTVDTGNDGDAEPEDWESIDEEQTEEDLPSGIRVRRPVVEYRDQPSDNKHTTLKKYQSSSSAEAKAAAPVIEEEPPAAEEGEIATLTLDVKTLRLLERLTNKSSQNTLPNAVAEHTGAPLSPTGPATLVAMLAMLAAIWYTMRKAQPGVRK